MSESTIAEAMKYVPGTVYYNYYAIKDRHDMVVGFRDSVRPSKADKPIKKSLDSELGREAKK